MDKIRITKQETEKGWSFNLKVVQVELFYLLSIFLSDEKYASILSDENDPLWRLASFGEPEMTRILVNSAVVGRVIDDRKSYFLPKNKSYCGRLIMNGKTTELNLGEAFNKIIHADSFDLEIHDTEENFSHLEPKIYLHGSFGKDIWEAEIDIISYVREYCRYINDLDKDAQFT